MSLKRQRVPSLSQLLKFWNAIDRLINWIHEKRGLYIERAHTTIDQDAFVNHQIMIVVLLNISVVF